MEANNFIQILRKINRGVSFNLWRVRIGGVEMALFFLFSVGGILVSEFIPMKPDTQYIVSETLSCISVLILGEAIMRSLYKLFPRYRWAVLATMAGSFAVGLIISGIFALIDGNNDKIWELLPMVGVALLLFVAATILWRVNVNKIKRIKLERELERKRRLRRGF